MGCLKIAHGGGGPTLLVAQGHIVSKKSSVNILLACWEISPEQLRIVNTDVNYKSLFAGAVLLQL